MIVSGAFCSTRCIGLIYKETSVDHLIPSNSTSSPLVGFDLRNLKSQNYHDFTRNLSLRAVS